MHTQKMSDFQSVEVGHYTEKGEEILCPVTGEWQKHLWTSQCVCVLDREESCWVFASTVLCSRVLVVVQMAVCLTSYSGCLEHQGP